VGAIVSGRGITPAALRRSWAAARMEDRRSGRRRGVAGWLLAARRAGQQGTRRAGLLGAGTVAPRTAPGAWRRGGPTRRREASAVGALEDWVRLPSEEP
jgi:hypothetical protein